MWKTISLKVQTGTSNLFICIVYRQNRYTYTYTHRAGYKPISAAICIHTIDISAGSIRNLQVNTIGRCETLITIKQSWRMTQYLANLCGILLGNKLWRLFKMQVHYQFVFAVVTVGVHDSWLVSDLDCERARYFTEHVHFFCV